VLHLALLAAAAAVVVAAVLVGEYSVERVDSELNCIAHLRWLQCLASLTLNMKEEECSNIVWRSIAKLTGLRDLHVREVDISQFGGIINLVDCRQLTRLRTDNEEESGLYFEMEVRVPPCVWLACLQPCVSCYTLHVLHCSSAFENKLHVQGQGG
jgi:hypothetical protein